MEELISTALSRLFPVSAPQEYAMVAMCGVEWILIDTGDGGEIYFVKENKVYLLPGLSIGGKNVIPSKYTISYHWVSDGSEIDVRRLTTGAEVISEQRVTDKQAETLSAMLQKQNEKVRKQIKLKHDHPPGTAAAATATSTRWGRHRSVGSQPAACDS